jgi:hypothetical protein
MSNYMLKNNKKSTYTSKTCKYKKLSDIMPVRMKSFEISASTRRNPLHFTSNLSKFTIKFRRAVP